MKEKEIITLDITALNSEGEGVGRVGAGGDGYVVFAPGALPGERVKCAVRHVGKSYASAVVTEILSASPDRIAPRCPSYGRCGGCQLQHASYQAQIKFKGETLADAIKRIGHIDAAGEIVCHPSPDEWGYRAKTVLPVGRRAGYYERRSHKIVPFDECPALAPALERVRKEMILANETSGLRGYDERAGKGDIRGVAARVGAEAALTGTIVTRELCNREFGRLRDIHQKMMSSDRAVSGSVLNIKTDPGNFVWGHVFKTLCGSPMVETRLGGYSFSVDISAFFQVNSAQAERIFQRVAEAAGQSGASRTLELYGGVGSLTAYLAGVAESVDSVEEWRPSARLMKENMERNGIGNVRAFGVSCEGFLRDNAGASYDTVVMDPPRTGASGDVINGVLSIAPRTVIYISCNPATLARDAARLIEGGYEVASIEAYDMFPQTSHVESMCVLTRGRI
jgi:23S rRNA (uracil1939-C5)-methyltransferase